MKFENLGNNIFSFKFGLEADKQKVMAGGPWHFDRGLIMLKEPNEIGNMRKQEFTHASTDILGNLMMLQKKLCREDLELLVSILWVIWHARNKFVLEGLKIDPNLSLPKAEAVNEAFRRTKFLDILNGENLHKKKPNVWTHPP